MEMIFDKKKFKIEAFGTSKRYVNVTITSTETVPPRSVYLMLNKSEAMTLVTAIKESFGK